MPKKATIYDVLVSCPSDVKQFVSILEKTINKFNYLYGKEKDIILRVVYWSKNVYSQYGSSPQKIINHQIVDSADMCVAVFWTKFGTSTDEFGSGTEEEIARIIGMKKQIFLYFLDKPVNPSVIDTTQFSKVIEFKQKYTGLYFNLNNEIELEQKFYEDLVLYFDSIIRGPKIANKKVNKEILWVDDCPENNYYERSILENYGFKFTLALSTEQAMQFLRQNEYGLIISDMKRKEGDQEGYILLEKIRAADFNIPFIIYASMTSELYKKETNARGGQGNTSDPRELIELVIKNT